ncbi:hypothetical protein [Photorhabdus luminescens]|uniref:hypothetical protein n=1 Tax=Photorhabdus luminescens TaxID=29488 RepID=UPI001595C481|nr:hypothetical protein [Photorhabdus luminescens]
MSWGILRAIDPTISTILCLVTCYCKGDLVFPLKKCGAFLFGVNNERAEDIDH